MEARRRRIIRLISSKGDLLVERLTDDSDYEESRELLELEIKKSSLLEETLKSAEIQLSKHEKLYEELEAKYRV
jgi:predicted nuclease with TOPRIM domain